MNQCAFRCSVAMAGWVMFANSPANSQELTLPFSDESTVSIVSGYKQRLNEAPATATIITRATIERLGAQSLAEVLEHVAGFNVLRSNDGRGTSFGVRGRRRPMQFQVNGIPYVTGLIQGWQDIANVSVRDIERIEIIRGPSSAIYGADAVGGVVNIITRTDSDNNHGEFGVELAGFDTKEAWLRFGKGTSSWSLNGYADYRSSNVQDDTIQSDAQSAFDDRFGTRASNAPAQMNQHRDVLDVRIIAQMENWKFSASHFSESDFHTGAGISLALDPTGIYDNRLDAVSVSYQSASNGRIATNGYLSASRATQEGRLTLYPPGAFAGLFPDGVRQGLEDHEDKLHLEYTATISVVERHTLHAGIGAQSYTFYPDSDIRNFIVRGGTIVPTGQYAEGAGVGDTPVVGRTRQRDSYAFAMDEWAVASDWRVSGGLRWDQFSAAGNTFNPRLAAIWLPSLHVSVKLQYATAFDLPSLVATSSNGTFTAKGNPNLKPIRTRMLDGVVAYASDHLMANLTLFWYRDTELLVLAPSSTSVNGLAYENASRAEGYGVESAAEFRPNSALTLSGTYSYQHLSSSTEKSNTSEAYIPKHKLTAAVSYAFSPLIALSANTVSVFDRQRPAGDNRPELRPYTLFGAHLKWTPLRSIKILVGARNLFDSDARQYSPASSLFYDLPLPGRQYFSDLSYKF